jgi:hypothetical protein
MSARQVLAAGAVASEMAGCGMNSSEAVAVLKRRHSKPYAPFYRLTEAFFATFLLLDLRLTQRFVRGLLQFYGQTVHKCSIFSQGLLQQLVINVVSGQKGTRTRHPTS